MKALLALIAWFGLLTLVSTIDRHAGTLLGVVTGSMLLVSLGVWAADKVKSRG